MYIRSFDAGATALFDRSGQLLGSKFDPAYVEVVVNDAGETVVLWQGAR